MDIKEAGSSQISERMPSKLNLMEQGIRESANFFDNLNNMNQSEEEQKAHAAPAGNVTSYLSPKEKRLWNSLSSNRKKKYEKNSSVVSKATSEVGAGTASAAGTSAGTLNANTAASNTVGEGSASSGAKGTASASAKGSASASAKGAATGAGGAATGGVLVAAEAAKKTAQTFKDTLQSRIAVQREQQQQIATKQKAQQTASKRSADEIPGLKSLVYLFGGVVLFIVIVFSSLFFLLFSGSSETPLGEGMVDVAQQELAQSEYQVGGHKYKDWYGMNEDWCMMFVAWCANECGYIERGCMPHTASVTSAKIWFEEKGQYYDKAGGYEPKEGDLVFFLNGMSHVGIVISYDKEKDQIKVIEGNSGISDATPYHEGSSVTQNIYQRTAKSISGFASPDYSEE